VTGRLGQQVPIENIPKNDISVAVVLLEYRRVGQPVLRHSYLRLPGFGTVDAGSPAGCRMSQLVRELALS
jgi:hypothetical protein